ncbi:MAG: acyltransferase family protein, partial [Solirubrobacteraceae bacterium]
VLVFVAHIAFAESTYASLGWDNMPGRDAAATFGGEIGLHAVLSPARLVNLFFAFSAYLLARPFIAWALGRERRPNTKNFYIRRVLRVMPGYWALCAGVVVWLVMLRGGPLETWTSIKTLLLVNGGWNHAGTVFSWVAPLAPTWTVRVEALGYLVLPLVGWIWFLLGRRWGMRGMVAGFGGIVALTLALRFAQSPFFDGPGPLQWLFIPGLAVALLEAHAPFWQWVSRRRRDVTLWLALLGFLILIGSEPLQVWLTQTLAPAAELATQDPDAFRSEVESALRAALAVSVPMQIVGAGLLLLCLLGVEWQGGRPPLRLDSPVARWIGARSYSLYLIHFPVLGLLLPHIAPDEKGMLGFLALGAVALPVAILGSAVLYRFVELPGIALGQRLTRRRPPSGPAEPPAPAGGPQVEALGGGATGPGVVVGDGASPATPGQPVSVVAAGDAGAAASAHAAGGDPSAITPGTAVPASGPDDGPPTHHTIRERMRWLRGGDAIRGWAMLGVMASHTATGAVFLATGGLAYEEYGSTLGAGIQGLNISVWAFFALSAYLLSRPYLSALYRPDARWPSLERYARHRVGRVGPTFWAVCLIVLALYGTLGSSTEGIVAMFAFAQVWDPQPVNQVVAHAWSLNVEVVFYFALPLLAWVSFVLVRRWRRVGPLLAVAVLTAVVVVATVFAQTWLPDATTASHSPIGGLVAFVPGVLVALLEVRIGPRLATWRAAPALAVAMPIIGLLVAYKMSSWVTMGSAGERFLDTAAAGLILAGVVLWQIAGRTTWPVVRIRFVNWIGERSYSIFMVHGIVCFEFREVGADQSTVLGRWAMYYLSVVAASVVIGGIIHELVERPAMQWSQRRRPLWRVRPLAPAE